MEILVLSLVGGVFFASLNKFQDYTVRIRANAKQTQRQATIADEVIVGNYSSEFKIKTLEDCMHFINNATLI